MKIPPPEKTPAHVLFRNLLELPRPKKLLKFRLQESPKTKLYVKALAAHEMPIDDPTEFDAQVIVKCLVLENNKPAFSSAEGLLSCLDRREVKIISKECLEALLDIGPIFIYCDFEAWMTKLEEGAKHPINYTAMNALGGCYDLVTLPDKAIFIEHPEQYFGVPKNQLLDCHWFAYWAARKVQTANIFKRPDEKEVLSAINQGNRQ